jgi:hypothetical protein
VIDMTEIERFNKRYKFKIKQLNENKCYIYDGVCEWIIEVYSQPNRRHKNVKLMHKNYKRNTNGWHPHAEYYDYKWVMGAIHNHTLKSVRSNNHLFRMKALFESLHT